MTAQAPPPGTHLHPVTVRWGECDPAGIVYYPRYYDYFHQAMESWFERALGMPYADVILARKLGFPSVHTEADFHRPSALGDELQVELRVASLGRTSIRFALRVLGAGELRVSGAKVVVCMGLDPARADHQRAVAVPADIRARIERFGVGLAD